MDSISFEQAIKTATGLQEVVNLSTKMLRTAMGYPDNHGPSTLLILVQEICEDRAEKTALLERVSEHLDKLEEINAQRKQDTLDFFVNARTELLEKKVARSTALIKDLEKESQ